MPEDAKSPNSVGVVDRRGGIESRPERAEAERQFDTAFGGIVIEVGIEPVDRQRQGRGNLSLESAVDAEPLELGRGDEALRSADDERAAGCAAPAIAPGVEFLQLVRLVGVGRGQRDTDGVVRELVHVGGVGAVAEFLRPGVERAQIGVGTLGANGEDLLAGFERTDGAHVDRADEALADQAGGGRLVNHDLIDHLGRVLVEFDGAVVAGGGLFAAVEQRLREVRTKAADRDDVGAAVQPLRGHARQAGDGFADGIVGQLADVFGGHRFQDQVANGVFRRPTISRLARKPDTMMTFSSSLSSSVTASFLPVRRRPARLRRTVPKPPASASAVADATDWRIVRNVSFYHVVVSQSHRVVNGLLVLIGKPVPARGVAAFSRVS